ncbi:MAG: hypothetical protein QM426_02560 [Euryarchaeota archaeon]|nr:hypothetical protein [Euryarchaeota archaeon]
MDEKDNKKSLLDRVRTLWSSLPEAIKLFGTILSIAIALKVLFPASAVGVNFFDAGPEIIKPGELSVLSWDVSGATNVTIEPDIGAVNSNGSFSVSPSETTTYKLMASSEGDKKIATCTVKVEEKDPLISSFLASPNSIKPGESAVLNWHVSGASKVNIEPDIGAVEPAGTLDVSPSTTTSYKLTASNSNKEDVAYCTVAVEENPLPPKESMTSEEEKASTPAENLPASEEKPSSENLPSDVLPSIASFNADPDVIAKGESSNLIWSVSDATEVVIEPGIGTAGLTGSQRIFPKENTTYTLTARNRAGSVRASKIVHVKGPSIPPSSVPLSTPEQVSPSSGTVFDNSTTQAVLKWKTVSGAENYTLEIDSYDSNTGKWLSESSGYYVVSGITGSSYSFKFLEGVEQYRWRVWAVSPEGTESSKSSWWTFTSQPDISTETEDTNTT